MAAAVVAVALLVRHEQQAPPLTVGSVQLRGEDVLAVTLVNRGAPVRVTDLSLRAGGLTAVGVGALADEVANADTRGVPVTHDADRVLPPGRHTLLLGVRAGCPSAVRPGQVLLTVEGDRLRRTLAAALPADVRDRLRCTPLSVSAGVSPVPPTPGQVGLLLTAHTGEPPAGGPFLRLSWPGYEVSGVGGVVPLALGWATADSNLVFGAVVSPDCGTPAAGGLTAVFADRSLPVPVTGAAAARVRALRADCR